MIERLIAIFLLVGFVFAVGAFVAPFISPKCWSRTNKYVLLARCERWMP